MSKQVILTGIRANNDLHIGNYLGALLPMVDMAKKHSGEYQVNMFVPDLHSFTTSIDHKSFNEGIMNNLRVFAAAGLPLDNPDVHIYRQSYIPAHSELTVILNNFTGLGEMDKMNSFREKAYKNIERLKHKESGVLLERHSMPEEKKREIFERVSMGLLDYPVLMAADILLYGTSYVPVGEDQRQHIEFTRNIAERLNNKFGELFVVPKSMAEMYKFFGAEQGLRVRDLVDPTKKMSKSDDTGKGVIFLSDTPDVVKSKILAATTDSLASIKHDYESQPGISNLLDLLKLFGGDPDEFIRQNQYGPLKAKTADLVADFITDFQAKLAVVDDKAILAKLETSEKEMTVQANATLLKVQKAVGLR